MILSFDIVQIADFLGLEWLKEHFGALLILLLVFALLYKFLYADNLAKQKSIIEKDKALLIEKDNTIAFLKEQLEGEKKENSEKEKFIRTRDNENLQTLIQISSFISTLIDQVKTNRSVVSEKLVSEAEKTRNTVERSVSNLEQVIKENV